MPRLDFRLVARLAGPILFGLVLALGPGDLSPAGLRTLAVTAWMVTWLITEAVPIVATSLLPLALFPMLGVASSRDAALPYGNELVFLFLGGFLLAAALERWQSHVRVAYSLVLAVGLTGRRAVLGVMLATGFISMWISNTATTAMMYPIAMAIGGLFARDEAGDLTRTALMLGVAYAATLGGMATLIGTPPNLVVAGAIEELTGRSIGFAPFMALGAPISLVLIPVCWALLVLVSFRARAALGGGARDVLRSRLEGLGPIRGGEARVLAIFLATATAWFLLEPKEFDAFRIPGLTDWLPQLSDAAIAIAAAVVLFVIPGRERDGATRPLLTWAEARKIPWDVLLFFGGGLSLAAALEATGVTTWIGSRLEGLAGLPVFAIHLGVAVTVLALSELASNLAVATMTMPIVAALAASVGQPPVVMMLVAGFAASTGFALPVATPPNAIVFGSGQITVRQMARAGILLDLVAVVVVVAVVTLLAPLVLGGQ
jgi:sodium-dependent dicarboxylate transporter 2/3/5